MKVNLSWPLKSPEESWVLYLSESPYVQYSKDTRQIRNRFVFCTCKV